MFTLLGDFNIFRRFLQGSLSTTRYLHSVSFLTEFRICLSSWDISRHYLRIPQGSFSTTRCLLHCMSPYAVYDFVYASASFLICSILCLFIYCGDMPSLYFLHSDVAGDLLLLMEFLNMENRSTGTGLFLIRLRAGPIHIY